MEPPLWFTADHHFGHRNIISHCKRPFASVEEMNETLIARWNSVVAPDDVVYHLGDIFLMASGDARKLRDRLHGRLCLLRGNHDKTADNVKGCFEWIKDYHELKVPDEETGRGTQLIVLCHYGFRVWNKWRYGSWNLFGHSHGSLPLLPHTLALDVGVDCHDFTPLSYAQIKVIMQGRGFVLPASREKQTEAAIEANLESSE